MLHKHYLLMVMTFLLLAFVNPLFAYEVDGLDLGRVWMVREYMPDGSVYQGTWTRRPRSPIFDAEWVYSATGGIARDVIEFRSVDDGQVVLYRNGLRQFYYGNLSRDGTRINHGTADWYAPGNYWTAVITGQRY